MAGPCTAFDTEFLTAWDTVKATPGVLRNTAYDATQRRVIGACGAVAQFNPEHIKTKRAPSTATASATAPVIPVSQPFYAEKFNFLKCKQEEVIVKFTLEEGSCRLTYTAHGGRHAHPEAADEHSWFINVNPLLPGHGLLTPFVTLKQPQVMQPEFLEVGLCAAAASTRPDLRLGFNSLGAWASVNHFHLHTFYVGDVFPAGRMPIECVEGALLLKGAVADGPTALPVTITSLGGWPLAGFSIQPVEAVSCAEPSHSTLLKSLAHLVGRFCHWLVQQNIAHNVLICDKGQRILVIPRQHQRGGGAESLELAIALAEATGLAIVYTEEAFSTLDEASYFATMKDFAVGATRLEEMLGVWRGLLERIPPSEEPATATAAA